MTMMRLPVYMWMTLIVAFLLFLSLPVVTVGLIQLYFDRNFGTNFFTTGTGGDPILWQHIFWIFGHPEVYVLILPSMGIVSEVLPRSEAHTSELQSLMRISYAVFCLIKKNPTTALDVFLCYYRH